MKKQLLLILLFTWITALPAHILAASTKAPDLQFERLSIAEGLSQSTAKYILQDRRGFIWISTRDGLNKYDGKNFTCYQPESGNPHSISSEFCTAICETRDGFLWVGTEKAGLNRFDPETGLFTRFQLDPDDPRSLADNSVTGLLEDSNGNLWVTTYSKGLNKYNRGTQTFTRCGHDPGEYFNRIRNRVFDISEDRGGKLWLSTLRGMDHFDPETETFSLFLPNPKAKEILGPNAVGVVFNDSTGNTWAAAPGGILYQLSPSGKSLTRHQVFLHPEQDDHVTAIHEDRDGYFWLGTNRQGLKIFEPDTGNVTTYMHDKNDPASLGNNFIRDICEDRSGILWLGTHGGGINKLDRRKEKFRTYRHDPDNPNSLAHNAVWSIFEDRRGDLWIATDSEGLDRLDQKTGTFTHYKNDPKNPDSLANNNLFCAIEDSEGMIWIGTQGAGLDRLDPETGKFTHYNPTTERKRNDPHALLSDVISHLTEDKDGNIWIGTLRGLNRWDRKTGLFYRYLHTPDSPHSVGGNFVEILSIDRSGNTWAAISGKGVYKYNTSDKTFTHYVHNPDDPNSLNDNDVLNVYEARSGMFWIGTGGGGLNRMAPVSGEFKHYTKKHGLPNNVVYSTLEDKRGNLWLSTNHGLSCFNPEKETFKNYDIRSGIQGYEFNARSFFKNKEGKMYFGGATGFSCFFPEQIRENPYIPDIVLTDFSILGRRVTPGGNSALDKDISHTARLVLSHRQNIFGFKFAALDYTNPESNQYKYRMDGLHDDWIYLGNENDISFTGLDPGTYTFRVTGSNSDGGWNETGTGLEIVITPPFWQTFWFRILVVVVGIALILAWHRRRIEALSVKLRTEASMEVLFEKYQISKREREIVQLLLKGKTNRDIEEELFISLRTVKCHVYNIYQKVGVKNRMELVTHFHPPGGHPAARGPS